MSPDSATTGSERVARRRVEASSGSEPFLSGPATGRLLRPFSPTSADGATVRLIDYKQRNNLLLFLHRGPGCIACRSFLSMLGKAPGSYAEVETIVLGISSDEPQTLGELTRQLRLPFSLLSDPAGHVAMQESLKVPAVVIADRFGEIWAAWNAGNEHALLNNLFMAMDAA